jgi:hypothetical protein
MKLFKTQFEKVKKWWKPESGTVSMWDLTMAQLQVKLLTGLTYILSREEQVTWKIRSGALETLSRAKATIARRRIQQIKPVSFQWSSSNPGTGFVAQSVASWSAYNIPPGANGPAGVTANYVPNNNITFQTPGKPVLTITEDGDVIWTGKPSVAADILVQSFTLAVENKKGVTKAARRRYYWKAVDNLARKSEQMTPEEFVDFVRKQAYNRERKVLIDTLKGVDL